MTETKQNHPRKIFRVYLIKPSHYDDDGYVIHWARSDIPSNTMAVLNGILLDCIDRRVLGDDVDLVITSFDEANTRIKPRQIIREIQASGGILPYEYAVVAGGLPPGLNLGTGGMLSGTTTAAGTSPACG